VHGPMQLISNVRWKTTAPNELHLRQKHGVCKVGVEWVVEVLESQVCCSN